MQDAGCSMGQAAEYYLFWPHVQEESKMKPSIFSSVKLCNAEGCRMAIYFAARWCVVVYWMHSAVWRIYACGLLVDVRGPWGATPA